MNLSTEQLIGAVAPVGKLYIEAGPGSGKTVVATARFGSLRFDGSKDRRGVAALSFTRSATGELRRRVVRRWGPISVASPSRVSTIDGFFLDVLSFALAEGLVIWPNNHVELNVRDDWSTVQRTSITDRVMEVTVLNGRAVVRETQVPDSAPRITPEAYTESIYAGHCTHEEVREVVRCLLEELTSRDQIGSWIVGRYKALIVDEVFDANPLDLELIAVAVQRGVSVVVIGDPWQALYEFRGARPDLVPKSLAQLGFSRLQLTKSYRFRDSQVAVTAAARGGESVALAAGSPAEVDVVLSTTWAPLLDSRRGILPLALGGTKSPRWALATLVLDAVASATLGLRAVDVAAALKRLSLPDNSENVDLYHLHEDVIACLRSGTPDKATRCAWECVISWVDRRDGALVGRPMRKKKELIEMRQILMQVSAPTAGISVHQAKGLEWDRVGLLLSESERRFLENGLSSKSEAERKVYVSLTRARVESVLI